MILFLVTHFRDGGGVNAFVDSVLSQDGCVAVCDNSPDAPLARAPSSNAAVYAPPSNLGYLNGCAFALHRWRAGGRAEPDFVVVSNTDLVLDDGFVRALSGLDAAGAGVIAPDVTLPDGTRQNPFMTRRPSRTRLELYRLVFESGVLTRLLDVLEGAKRRSRGDAGPRDIYAAHGSVFALTKEFFARGGTLELDGFMYGEEIHIAEQARRRGLRVVFAPALRAAHQRRASTAGVSRRLRREWARERLRVVLREYY